MIIFNTQNITASITLHKMVIGWEVILALKTKV